jgi:hypothetical protein
MDITSDIFSKCTATFRTHCIYGTLAVLFCLSNRMNGLWGLPSVRYTGYQGSFRECKSDGSLCLPLIFFLGMSRSKPLPPYPFTSVAWKMIDLHIFLRKVRDRIFVSEYAVCLGVRRTNRTLAEVALMSLVNLTCKRQLTFR